MFGCSLFNLSRNIPLFAAGFPEHTMTTVVGSLGSPFMGDASRSVGTQLPKGLGHTAGHQFMHKAGHQGGHALMHVGKSKGSTAAAQVLTAQTMIIVRETKKIFFFRIATNNC